MTLHQLSTPWPCQAEIFTKWLQCKKVRFSQKAEKKEKVRIKDSQSPDPHLILLSEVGKKREENGSAKTMR
jgi:hypothetical protein